VRRALLIEVDAEVDDRMEHQYVAVVGLRGRRQEIALSGVSPPIADGRKGQQGQIILRIALCVAPMTASTYPRLMLNR
jgi:hypothetical protein